MPDVNYRIGGLRINKENLEFIGSSYNSYNAHHRFVTEENESTVSIFVIETDNHIKAGKAFGLNLYKLNGGGSIYLNREKTLVLDNYSGSFGTIPKEVAQELGELVAAELEKEGTTINGVFANPESPDQVVVKIKPRWKELGFE